MWMLYKYVRDGLVAVCAVGCAWCAVSLSESELSRCQSPNIATCRYDVMSNVPQHKKQTNERYEIIFEVFSLTARGTN